MSNAWDTVRLIAADFRKFLSPLQISGYTSRSDQKSSGWCLAASIFCPGEPTGCHSAAALCSTWKHAMIWHFSVLHCPRSSLYTLRTERNKAKDYSRSSWVSLRSRSMKKTTIRGCFIPHLQFGAEREKHLKNQQYREKIYLYIKTASHQGTYYHFTDCYEVSGIKISLLCLSRFCTCRQYILENNFMLCAKRDRRIKLWIAIVYLSVYFPVWHNKMLGFVFCCDMFSL